MSIFGNDFLLELPAIVYRKHVLAGKNGLPANLRCFGKPSLAMREEMRKDAARTDELLARSARQR